MKDVIRTGNFKIAAMMVIEMTLVTLQRLSTSFIYYYHNMADILGANCKIARVSNFISINVKWQHWWRNWLSHGFGGDFATLVLYISPHWSYYVT